jgi:hypothetical protein
VQLTPNILAVSTLINARGSVSVLSSAFPILHSALWSLIWDLSGDELTAALLLVNIDNARERARLGMN